MSAPILRSSESLLPPKTLTAAPSPQNARWALSSGMNVTTAAIVFSADAAVRASRAIGRGLLSSESSLLLRNRFPIPVPPDWFDGDVLPPNLSAVEDCVAIGLSYCP